MTLEQILTKHGIYAGFRSTYTYDGIQAAMAEYATQEKEALQRFKDFVHRRLDEMGIETHPEGEHSKAGCRIGDRLDIVQNKIAG